MYACNQSVCTLETFIGIRLNIKTTSLCLPFGWSRVLRKYYSNHYKKMAWSVQTNSIIIAMWYQNEDDLADNLERAFNQLSAPFMTEEIRSCLKCSKTLKTHLLSWLSNLIINSCFHLSYPFLCMSLFCGLRNDINRIRQIAIIESIYAEVEKIVCTVKRLLK